MQWVIELEDLPALVAEIMDEIHAGAGPLTITRNGLPIATMTCAMPEGRQLEDIEI